MQKRSLFALLWALLLLPMWSCSEDQSEPSAPLVVIEVETPAPLLAVGGEFDIAYTVNNPVEGTIARATSDQPWLKVVGTSRSAIRVRAEVWTGEEARTAQLTVSYSGAADVVLTVTQAAPTVARNLTFTFELLEVTSRSVRFNCTPSNLSATYVGTIIEKSDWDNTYKSDEGFIDHYVNSYLPWVEEELGYGIESLLRRGALENYDIGALTPEKEYYFAAFGMNEDLTVTSPEIFKMPFTTTSPEKQECRFEISVRPGLEYTYIGVSPSTWEVEYLWGVMPKEEYDALGENPGKRIMEQIRAEVDRENAAGGEAWFGDYVVAADQSRSYSNLEVGKVYTVYAFGCDVTGRGEPTTEVFTQEFTEQRVAGVDCTFAFSFSNIRASSFAAQITPSNSEVRWIAYTMPYEEFSEAYTSVEYMAEIFLDALTEIDPNWMAPDSEYLFQGAQWLTNFDMLNSLLVPETAYIVIAFGVDESGRRVTRVMSTTATTTAVGSPSSMLLEIEAEPIGYQGAEVTFEGSEREIFFYDLVPAYYRDEFESDTHFMEYMAYDYEVKGLLEYKLQVGHAEMLVEEGLKPGTEYLAYAFGYDHKPSTALFTKRFTTGSFPMGGEATVTEIVVRVEDGDRYYAMDPSTYAACKGRALLTCYSTTDSRAVGYYQVNFSDLDPAATDQQMVDWIVAWGDRSEISYIVEWDQPCTLAALAVDAQGRAGEILRREITPRKSDLSPAAVRMPRLKERPF